MSDGGWAPTLPSRQSPNFGYPIHATVRLFLRQANNKEAVIRTTFASTFNDKSEEGSSEIRRCGVAGRRWGGVPRRSGLHGSFFHEYACGAQVEVLSTISPP